MATNPMFAGFVAIFSFKLPKIGLYMFSINVQHINLYQKNQFLVTFYFIFFAIRYIIITFLLHFANFKIFHPAL